MRYLIIGDAGSMHIYSFVRTVLLPKGYEVHLFTLSREPVRRAYRDFYRQAGVQLHSICELRWPGVKGKSRLVRLIQLGYKAALFAALPPMDLCHVHSVYKTSMWLIRLFPRKYKHLILSYWGSDVENEPEKIHRLREKSFPRAGCITLTMERMVDLFREIYGECYDDKLTVCRFATEGLECVRRLAREKTREQCREEYGIPREKICVTCGYNAAAAQQQDACLKAIAQLPPHLKDRIYVILPMQYAADSRSYIQRVKQRAEACGAPYRILEEFVPFEKSAMLAIATDIYIHVRLSDAFSNALKEQVYAGSEIIKGGWLKYRELEQMGFEMTDISSARPLAQVLEEKLTGFVPKEEIVLYQPIYDLYSCSSTREQWEQVIRRATGG